MTANKNYILDQQTASKKLRRMAFEILENNAGEAEIVLAGIYESGSVVARCIQRILAEISPIKTSLLVITIDKKNPKEVKTDATEDLSGKVIIVIDDVANSGKTLLYALKPFLEFYPKKIQVLVLVSRSHNSFPVYPDYTGLSVATTLQEHIVVEVDNENIIGAYLQ